MNNMKIRKRYFLCLLFILSNLTIIETLPAETLEDAWAVSIASDHSLKAAENDLEAARFEVSAAKGARLPKLNLYSGYTFLNEKPGAYFGGNEVTTAEDHFLSYHARVSVPIYTHFQITNGIEAAESNLEAAGFKQTARTQDIKLQVAEAYINVLLAQKWVDVAESHVKSLTAIANDVQNLYDQGMVAVNDLLAAKVSLADARQKQLNVHNMLDTAKSAYNRILVRSLDEPVELASLEFTAPEDSVDALTQQAMDNRAELAVLSKQIEALEKNAAAQKAATGPQIFISGGTEYTENSHQVHEDLWSANISLSWDIFDGNISRHKSSASLKRAGSVKEQQMDYASMIRLEVRTAWLKMQESKERIKVAEDALKQAEENLNVSRNRYQEGVGTNTDVLNAESLRIDSRVNYENAYYSFGLSIMRLKRATGEI
jgi:outer membrane protein TolC